MGLTTSVTLMAAVPEVLKGRKPLPPLEVLQEHLRLDDDGTLWWKVRKRGRVLSKPAARANRGPRGYKGLMFDGEEFYAHRVVWALANGQLPPPHLDVDHLNGDPCDNRPFNLRLATRQQNLHNTETQGCCRTQSGKYAARMMVGGTMRHLGTYSTMKDAQEVTRQAKKLVAGLA